MNACARRRSGFWRLVARLTVTASLLLAGCRCDGGPSPENTPLPAAPPPPAPAAPPPAPAVDAASDSVDASDASTDGAPALPSRHTRKKAPAREDAPSGGGISAVKVTGNLPKPVADEIVRGKASALRGCAAGTADAPPDLRGQVQFKLTVNDRGVVELAEVLRSTLGGNEAEMCMVQAIRRLKFPPPPGGGESTVAFQMGF